MEGFSATVTSDRRPESESMTEVLSRHLKARGSKEENGSGTRCLDSGMSLEERKGEERSRGEGKGEERKVEERKEEEEEREGTRREKRRKGK